MRVYCGGGRHTATCRQECGCISRAFAQQTRGQKWLLKTCCHCGQIRRTIPGDAAEGCRCTCAKRLGFYGSQKAVREKRRSAWRAHDKHGSSVQNHRDHFGASEFGAPRKVCLQQLGDGHDAARVKHVGTRHAQAIVAADDVAARIVIKIL